MKDYLNKHKWVLLITCLVILLPMAAGILFWEKLPKEIVVHWGIDGVADGFVHKKYAVFYIPLGMLALHLVCFFASAWDPKQKNISKKMMGLVLWIIPMLSLLLSVVMYANALNRPIDISVLIPLFLGVLWIVVGNYLPKCKQSYTIGIKLPWTLEDEENWNATHRLGGKLWVAGGVLTMATALLPPMDAFIALMVILAVMILVPTVYSYRLYKKKHN